MRRVREGRAVRVEDRTAREAAAPSAIQTWPSPPNDAVDSRTRVGSAAARLASSAMSVLVRFHAPVVRVRVADADRCRGPPHDGWRSVDRRRHLSSGVRHCRAAARALPVDASRRAAAAGRRAAPSPHRRPHARLWTVPAVPACGERSCPQALDNARGGGRRELRRSSDARVAHTDHSRDGDEFSVAVSDAIHCFV